MSFWKVGVSTFQVVNIGTWVVNIFKNNISYQTEQKRMNLGPGVMGMEKNYSQIIAAKAGLAFLSPLATPSLQCLRFASPEPTASYPARLLGKRVCPNVCRKGNNLDGVSPIIKASLSM